MNSCTFSVSDISVTDIAAAAAGALRVVVLSLAAILGACSTEPPAPPAATVATPTAPPPQPPAIDYRRVNALLDAGLYAMDDDRLITPLDHCAYDYFRAVLVIAPDEPRALAGLERIVERYLELAEQAIARSQWASARTMIGRASIVDADHPGIAQVSARVDMLRLSRREAVPIDASALSARAATLRTQLIDLGGRAKQPNVQVTIIVRNDADGRWIYQQMREAPGDARVQAQIQLGSPPRLEFLTLPDAPDVEGE